MFLEAERQRNRKIKLKSIWRPRWTGPLWTFVCPLCRTSRALPYSSRPGNYFQMFQIFLTSLVFTGICWNWFQEKGIVSFFPFWVLFELVYRWKRRIALVCRDCGFDPFLYKIDLNWAKREIEAHWKKKFAEKGIPYPGTTPSPTAAAPAPANPATPVSSPSGNTPPKP